MHARLLLAPLLILAACGGEIADGTLTLPPIGQVDIDALGEKTVVQFHGRGGPTVDLIYFTAADRATETKRKRFTWDMSLSRRVTGPQFIRIVNPSDRPAPIHYRVVSSGSAEMRTTLK